MVIDGPPGVLRQQLVGALVELVYRGVPVLDWERAYVVGVEGSWVCLWDARVPWPTTTAGEDTPLVWVASQDIARMHVLGY